MAAFMKRILLVLAAGSLRLAAAESSIELDPARTTVQFTLSDVLHTVHGTFKLKRGVVKFDPATGHAWGEIVVDVTSGNSGSGARDKRMHEEILESARYPDAVFTPDHMSGELAPQGESQMELHGNFQIHGAAHELTLHLRAQVKNGDVAASTGFVIPYVQWGMKNPSNFLLKVSKNVELTVQTAGRVQ